MKLVVANIGDSRAVLCKNGTGKQITVDHDPLKERELVESKGGFVSKKPGINLDTSFLQLMQSEIHVNIWSIGL